MTAPTAFQLAVVAGALIGAGVALLIWRLVPAQPDLRDALERLSPQTCPPAATPHRPTVGDATQRLGQWGDAGPAARGVGPHPDKGAGDPADPGHQVLRAEGHLRPDRHRHPGAADGAVQRLRREPAALRPGRRRPRPGRRAVHAARLQRPRRRQTRPRRVRPRPGRLHRPRRPRTAQRVRAPPGHGGRRRGRGLLGVPSPVRGAGPHPLVRAHPLGVPDEPWATSWA